MTFWTNHSNHACFKMENQDGEKSRCMWQKQQYQHDIFFTHVLALWKNDIRGMAHKHEALQSDVATIVRGLLIL